MKIPTIGQVVLFHFEMTYVSPGVHRDPVLITRPAIIMEARPTGNCAMSVCWRPDDMPSTHAVNNAWLGSGYRLVEPYVDNVLIARDGTPSDWTWSFRPEDLR